MRDRPHEYSGVPSRLGRAGGPRPAIEWEVAEFPSDFELRTDVPPGITGLWQVSGRSLLSTLDMLRLDVEYVDRRSFALDVRILAQTLPVLARGDGAG